MENKIDNSVSKKGVITGLFWSFLVFVVTFPIVAIIIFGESVRLESQTYPFDYSQKPILLIWLSPIPFLILNNIIFFLSKNKSHRMGLLFGHIFVILMLLFYFYI